jgi:hypothetical protein
MYCTVIRSVLFGLEVVFLFYCSINIDGSLVGFDAEAVIILSLRRVPRFSPDVYISNEGMFFADQRYLVRRCVSWEFRGSFGGG